MSVSLLERQLGELEDRAEDFAFGGGAGAGGGGGGGGERVIDGAEKGLIDVMSRD